MVTNISRDDFSKCSKRFALIKIPRAIRQAKICTAKDTIRNVIRVANDVRGDLHCKRYIMQGNSPHNLTLAEPDICVLTSFCYMEQSSYWIAWASNNI